MNDAYCPPAELRLGIHCNGSVPQADQRRQRAEVAEILDRLSRHPGVVLADEVGMGKTYVALAVAYSVAVRSPKGPVVVMVPGNLVDKWEQDLGIFCELYLHDRRPARRDGCDADRFRDSSTLRYGVARNSVEFLKLLDDAPRERCQLIFLAQGAMASRQSDKWVRLALIAEALRRHGRGGAAQLVKVRRQIHRFLGELLKAVGEQKAHGWGEELWQALLHDDPAAWKETYNRDVRSESHRLTDDPVPKSILRALRRIDVRPLTEALKRMPIRASVDEERTSERLDEVRAALRRIEESLWKELLTKTRWRSPLLVMDEAHHLKNPRTCLARQLQSGECVDDLRTGDGAMAGAFDRMLFLTATPFQLGHRELVQVLRRFGDVRWDEADLGPTAAFADGLQRLGERLDASQRTAIALQRCWSRLRPEDGPQGGEDDCAGWWRQILASNRETLTSHQRAVIDAHHAALEARQAAEDALRPWILRHNKGTYWAGSDIIRRIRRDGAMHSTEAGSAGLPIPSQQLLPFFLAARSATSSGQDLLGEALCSSYEAFRYTRSSRDAGRDDLDAEDEVMSDLARGRWYLAEFDTALRETTGAIHPKVTATVLKAADLWEAGEKVLIFAFYRKTCRALRRHLSDEIERRCLAIGQQRLRDGGLADDPESLDRIIERIQRRYFDDPESPGRQALESALGALLRVREESLTAVHLANGHARDLVDVMRRFLRVKTTLIRCFPLAEWESLNPDEVVARTLDTADASQVTWRQKFEGFLDFLVHRCSGHQQRIDYVAASLHTQTGGIRVDDDDDDEDPGSPASTVTLANVQVATGTTRRETRTRLMRAFNTPFFPDILVCSEVMGEGVDLHRFCRHVIHHDPAWNPSTIEQRTGRIDRLGCKAEGRHPIVVYIPFLAGTADERQYRVMSERERWFRVVMGQDEVARLISPGAEDAIPLPDAVADGLSFRLGLGNEASSEACTVRVAAEPAGCPGSAADTVVLSIVPGRRMTHRHLVRSAEL